VSTDPTQQQPTTGAGAPSEAELRAAYEAELERVSVADMMAQASVSLLNLAARRLGGRAADDAASGAAPAPRDLEQVRDGIDGVRALLDILERRMPEEVRPLRDALSQLQLAYAAAVGGGEGSSEPSPGGEQKQPEDDASGPGPAQSSGRLWVPGS
jgi:hypothetical protein